MAVETVVNSDGMDGTPHKWDEAIAGQYAGGLVVSSTGATRTGIIPASGSPLTYVAKSGMVGTLKAGRMWVASPVVFGGGWWMDLPADVDLTHGTSHASLARTDLVIAEVLSDGTGSSFRKFRILAGTAGAGTPSNSVSLTNGTWVTVASVSVPANTSSLGAITQLSQYTVAAGGMLPLPGAMALAAGSRQAVAAALASGQPWVDMNATPIALGIVRAGDLCPTNRRKLHDSTRGGSPSYSDVSGTGGSTLLSSGAVTLVGGTRHIQVTGAVNVMGATGSGSLRVYLTGGGQPTGTGWLQGKTDSSSGADRWAGQNVWSLETSGTQTFTLMALVEGSASTIRVDGIRLQVHDLGPA